VVGFGVGGAVVGFGVGGAVVGFGVGGAVVGFGVAAHALEFRKLVTNNLFSFCTRIKCYEGHIHRVATKTMGYFSLFETTTYNCFLIVCQGCTHLEVIEKELIPARKHRDSNTSISTRRAIKGISHKGSIPL
jgi:hypothetical protein